ncbi:MAG: arylsulfatase [Bacteroidales bacterium]|nr:arylsulfatase [Bacteroidales bacterium]
MKNTKKLKLAGTALIPLAAAACSGQESAPRPNIVVILTDDMGYSDLGCYGGEIQTPNIDNLAQNGLRWSQFYNNARSCPSRAVLMTGLYPHQAGMGWMAAADEQTESYHGGLNNSCVTIAEVLNEADYETYMVGKWHLCSERQCEGEVKETWPMGRGFRHFYGIPEGASHYFHARMVSDSTRLKVSGDDFYITDALADSAAAYVHRHDYGEKPMFMYLAFNAPHWPLHAHQEDIARYVDTYRAGWDSLREARFAKQIAMGLFGKDTELSPRDVNVPAWDSLTPEQQHEFTMRMAIYAAQVDAIDKGVGKLVQALKDAGQFDNTVIMLMDDNGACAEYISGGRSKEVTGQADTYESYRINWANLSSTPYREYKHYTNEGGIATPLIVSWPGGIKKRYNGTFVREYGYFADIMATCIDLAGAEYPSEYNGHAITPCEGVSLLPNFSGKKTGRGMTFWEHEINIAVRDGKWKLNILNRENDIPDLTRFELYDMEKDPTELHNLASQYPERAEKMFRAWESWAGRAGVYPLCNRGYGQRQQGFRRVINGTFDDNFGGWGRHCSGRADVRFSIDGSYAIDGKKCALVDIVSQGERPADAIMKWVFPTGEKMTATIGFSYKTDVENTLWLRMENAGNPSEKQFSKEITLSPGGGTAVFDNVELEKGRYQLAFYFGSSGTGKIWIDNVVMDLKSENE